jgi:hypothetical protein
VKLSTLLELIGSGSILLVVGAGAVLLGVGFGFSEATHLPLWVSFCGLGLLAVAVGIVLIDRGSDEAEEHVTKAMSPMVDVVRSPWTGFAAAILGGIVLQRLLRPKRRVVVKRPTVVPVEVTPAVSPAPPKAPPAAEAFSLSRFLGGQLRSLGSVAAESAVAMGMQAIGVNSLEELVRELLEGKQRGNPKKPAAGEPRFGGDQPNWGSEPPPHEAAGSRGPTQPSHNGFNYGDYGADV